MRRQILRGLLLLAIAAVLYVGLAMARAEGLIPPPGRSGPAPAPTSTVHQPVTLQPHAAATPPGALTASTSRIAVGAANRRRPGPIVDSTVANPDGTDGVAVENLTAGEELLLNADGTSSRRRAGPGRR